MARWSLRRRRRERPAASTSAAPTWQTVDGGVVCCRFCAVLRELFTFKWEADLPRFQRLYREGECFVALPGPRFRRIEAGEEFSLFRMVDADAAGFAPGTMPPTWFRNSDMVMDGTNVPKKRR